MAIRSFISLSIAFTEGFDTDTPNSFLSRRVVREYEDLSVRDRLRIHGIIDKQDHVFRPRFEFGMASEPDVLHALETMYSIIVQGNKEDILLELNRRRVSNEEPYAKLKLYGCIPVYIAIDLAHAIKDPAIPPYQAALEPVQG